MATTPTALGPVALINLTSHDIRVMTPSGITCFRKSGGVARLNEVTATLPPLATTQGDQPLKLLSYAGEVEGLPVSVPGIGYIVSRVVAAAVVREDLFFPADEIRDEQGQIIGCSSLARFRHAPAMS